MSDVLARQDDVLSPDDITELLRDRLEHGVVDTKVEFKTFTVYLAPDAWLQTAELCRDLPALDYDLFDCLFGVDAREDGFDVVAVLYSTSTGSRITLRTRCEGGRDAPRCPSITSVYRGANWMERETWDMFGIEFDGHPQLEPRLLTVENFEGWPLRKDFQLSSRVAKAWPGVKEPVELDEEGNVIERVTGIGDAPGPYDLDKAMAEQAKAINTRQAEVEAGDDAAAETTDAAAGASETEANDGGDDAGVADAAGDADGASDADAGAATDDDAAAQAKAKADARRKEQAAARKRKAEQRAADSEGADRDDADGNEEGNA
ncbi:MAG: NADH-quinone oxidoreductase subunit C [Nitriliruptoraceae bacterium]